MTASWPVAMIPLIVALLAAPLAVVEAQPAGKVYRVGYLATRPTLPPYLDPFLGAMREHGWVEGRNVVYEWRFADGRVERLPELAADLARRQVDVIVVTPGGPTAEAAKAATRTIPVVMIASHDAVGSGLVASLARPGGNLTGIDSMAPDLDAKRLQLLTELTPRASRVAVLYNPNYPPTRVHLRQAEAAAKLLGITLRPLEVRDATELDRALTALLAERPDALLTLTDSLVFAERQRIVDFAAQTKLVAIHEFKEFAEAGGLIAYGANLKEMFRRAASYVDRILRGARAAELPIEQPTQFELVINVRTAKALGLTIPQSILLRADQVID